MATTLTSLPEEILERILAYALTPSATSSESQPALLKSPFTRSTSTPFPASSKSSSSRSAGFNQFSRTPVYRYSPLLVCNVFARIGTALVFSDLHVKTPEQCSELEHILRQRPDLARCVKALRLDGIWEESKGLVKAFKVSSGRLENFDICITQAEDESALQVFCDALAALPTVGTVKHLRVRKASDAYLTLPAPNRVLEVLGDTIPRWQSLESVNIGFRLPSGPRTSSPSAPSSPVTPMSGVTQLVVALAQAPSLKTVHAELPAVWNTALLAISNNPSLHSITLSPAPPVAGGHMFLAEARKHPRLAELLENGAPAPLLQDRVGRTHLRISVPPQSRSNSHGRMRANTTAAISQSPRALAFPESSALPRCPESSAASSSSLLSVAGSSSRPRRTSSRLTVDHRAAKGNRRMSAV